MLMRRGLAIANRWGSRWSLVASNYQGKVVALEVRRAAINGNINR
jgi:hypothetical protein